MQTQRAEKEGEEVAKVPERALQLMERTMVRQVSVLDHLAPISAQM